MDKWFALRVLADGSIEITRRICAITDTRTMGTEGLRSSDPSGYFSRKSGKIMACPFIGSRIFRRLFRAGFAPGQ